jgi:hypothetical protein
MMVLKPNEGSCAGIASTVESPLKLNSTEKLPKEEFQQVTRSKTATKVVETLETPHTGFYSAKELAEEKEFTNKLTPQDLAARAANMISKIPPHEAIKASNYTVSLTLDFTKPASFWVGVEFVTYRQTLLSALPLYHFLFKRLHIKLNFPSYRGQSQAVKRTQEDLVNRIATLVDEFPMMDKITVAFKSPETNWVQIEALAALYQIKGKWGCVIKEGQQSLRPLRCGDVWDQRLKGRYRAMVEQRELYPHA